MTLGDLIREFRILVQDTAQPYLFPGDELITWFNGAEREAAIRGKLLVDSDVINVTPGVVEYELPDRLFDIQHAELRSAGKFIRPLDATDRRSIDRVRPGWRTETAPLCGYIHDHDQKKLVLTSVPDAEHDVFIEFLRTPSGMSSDSDSPEISDLHHERLIDWVIYKGCSKPDAETLDPGRAAKAYEDFTRYFGKNPGADMRRRQNANRPHRTKSHW